jgi:hypothetical protein
MHLAPALTALLVPALLQGCFTTEHRLTQEKDEDTFVQDSGERLDDTEAPEPPALTVTPTTVAPPFETAVFDAGQLGDEVAEVLWTLTSQPEGSAVRLMETGGSTAEITPDLAGEYEVRLQLVDRAGNRSEPVTALLSSTPSQALWIEMFWAVSPDDMDLHLLAPGGELETNTDCYFATCVGGGLDWGERGDETDDPALDLDDVPGTGPENINIAQPHDGVFQVWVHDYSGSNGWDADYLGDNLVIVKVYLQGVLAWSDARDVADDDSYTPFCSIDMPSGVITTLSLDADTL